MLFRSPGWDAHKLKKLPPKTSGSQDEKLYIACRYWSRGDNVYHYTPPPVDFAIAAVFFLSQPTHRQHLIFPLA